MTQVTEADRKCAAETYNEFFGVTDSKAEDMHGDWLARRFAAHRIQARKEALEEMRSAIFTYAERATEAAQSGLQIAYSIANEVE